LFSGSVEGATEGIEEHVAAPAPSAATPRADTKALQDRVVQLEQRVAQLERAIAGLRQG
jgi:uncharacterized protein YceH (UPF0502 family)